MGSGQEQIIIATEDNSHISLISQHTSNIHYYGLAGDIVKVIEPYSEADPIALLVQFLSVYGCLIGNKPHFLVEDNKHALKIYPILVGRTSKGRKGTSWARIRDIIKKIDPEWAKTCITSGLSSGEGLISVAEKATGKGLLIVEQELALVLKVIIREGNTLSVFIREAWDSEILNTCTKNPLRAENTHIAIIGHTTQVELVRHITETDMANGFANRFLWLIVNRSKFLPDGASVPEVVLNPLIDRLSEALKFAAKVGEIKRDKNASEVWHKVYPDLSSGKDGIVGALLGRAEAHVMRLACIYALLDLSAVVKPEHLEAALGLWTYAELSVSSIFGNKTGYPEADTIYSALLNVPTGLTRTEISCLFYRHRKAEQIDRAIGYLIERNMIYTEQVPTEGRSEKRYRAK